MAQPEDMQAVHFGPVLYFLGAADGRSNVTALIVVSSDVEPPKLITEDGGVAPDLIWDADGNCGYRYAFSLPMRRDSWYEVDGAIYEVNSAFEGDLRIAFVSCNGQEHGDRGRSQQDRNALWARLVHDHERSPFQLMLHGGDQIYADELADAHPLTQRWANDADPDPTPVSDPLLQEAAAALRRAFFERYVEVLSEPETAWLMARIPSVAMWDDHDICDGWGSLPVEKLDSPVGRTLFSVARETALLFQFGVAPGSVPPICTDPTGRSLSWHVRMPGAQVIAPDLRSERRPDRVMDETGWRALEASLSSVDDGRVFLLSSVPALGPRLSWVEAVMQLTSRMEKYEDDLRDQWQSHAHRAEWRRFLERLIAVHENPQTPVTVISGEIHLATRGTLEAAPGPIHQLVASGISHPEPPRAYALGLGALARLGETPVPGHSIKMHPLPGRRGIYAAQRNYLTLEGRNGHWQAVWELEKTGKTPSLDI
ncbi:alkaline phosphatase D family protein [Amorphus orientalis]|uniref:PhoD-like phosphatase domain-containing protein n=1 Tax=Amorphus orientalis TaxID=649198 RepID=A0AAE3VL25_9HYPH|nr:alkaline phosphatase D family protein [Amorphus orientalis]MDQ0314469.1 hypothetical protein [Amorphus orientalis]